MGIENSSILNDYEGKYLNYIFNIDPQDFNLVGKKVGFLGSKKDYSAGQLVCQGAGHSLPPRRRPVQAAKEKVCL